MSGRTAVVQNADACQLCGHCVQVCRPAAITLNG
jgi:NAD-dependent dihydropyrimidine dehydrogenase PreA subunit